MEAAADLVAAKAVVAAVASRFLTASDDELLADVGVVEEIGRMVDWLRLSGAAEMERRSHPLRGAQGLAFRHGARDGVQLVEQVTRTPHRVARWRVGLGSALAPTATLAGDAVPGRFPVLADAIASGKVGIESARVIVEAALTIQKRVVPAAVEQLVIELTGIAGREETAFVRHAAQDLAEALDPDGAEPRERARRRKRALRLGATLADGTTRLSMVLTPEHLALIRELLQSRRRAKPLFRTTPGGDGTCEDPDPQWRETQNPDGGEPRTQVQEDYDTVVDTITAGVKAEHDGTMSTAVAHEVVVTVTADALEARKGQGWTAGVLAGLPIPTVERQTCTSGIRLLVTGTDGEALYLSRSHRVFSPAQKKALTVASGGRCQYPGCRTQAPYLEAHHAQWYTRDGGETHIDNGILLCSYHHHLVHIPHSPVQIRQHQGDLWIVPAWWTGPPEERHRRQSAAQDQRRRDELRHRDHPSAA